jgi:hypothetical protein
VAGPELKNSAGGELSHNGGDICGDTGDFLDSTMMLNNSAPIFPISPGLFHAEFAEPGPTGGKSYSSSFLKIGVISTVSERRAAAANYMLLVKTKKPADGYLQKRSI